MMLSVSYSTFHKSCRRSTDFVCLFNMGCQTDRELMMKEFAHKQHQCEFFMSQIGQRAHRRDPEPERETFIGTGRLRNLERLCVRRV